MNEDVISVRITELEKTKKVQTAKIEKAAKQIREITSQNLGLYGDDLLNILDSTVKSLNLFDTSMLGADKDKAIALRQKQIAAASGKVTTAIKMGAEKVNLGTAKSPVNLLIHEAEMILSLRKKIVEHAKFTDLSDKDKAVASIRKTIENMVAVHKENPAAENLSKLVENQKKLIVSLTQSTLPIIKQLEELRAQLDDDSGTKKVAVAVKKLTESADAAIEAVVSKIEAVTEQIESAAPPDDEASYLEVKKQIEANRAEDKKNTAAGVWDEINRRDAAKKGKIASVIEKIEEEEAPESPAISAGKAPVDPGFTKSEKEEYARLKHLAAQGEKLTADEKEAYNQFKEIEKSALLEQRGRIKKTAPASNAETDGDSRNKPQGFKEKKERSFDKGINFAADVTASTIDAIAAFDSAIIGLTLAIEDSASRITATVVEATDIMMEVMLEYVKKGVAAKFANIDQMERGETGGLVIEKLDSIHSVLTDIKGVLRTGASGSNVTVQGEEVSPRPKGQNLSYYVEQIGFATAEALAGTTGGVLAPEKFQHLLPKYEKGGYVPKTGPILAHAGEWVIPRSLAEGTNPAIDARVNFARKIAGENVEWLGLFNNSDLATNPLVTSGSRRSVDLTGEMVNEIRRSTGIYSTIHNHPTGTFVPSRADMRNAISSRYPGNRMSVVSPSGMFTSITAPALPGGWAASQDGSPTLGEYYGPKIISDFENHPGFLPKDYKINALALREVFTKYGLQDSLKFGNLNVMGSLRHLEGGTNPAIDARVNFARKIAGSCVEWMGIFKDSNLAAPPLVHTSYDPQQVGYNTEMSRLMQLNNGKYSSIHNHPIGGAIPSSHDIGAFMGGRVTGARDSIVSPNLDFCSITAPPMGWNAPLPDDPSQRIGSLIAYHINSRVRNEEAENPYAQLREIFEKIGLKDNLVFGSLNDPESTKFLDPGGPLRLGQSAFVGENGVEAVVPSTRGSGFEVIPNRIAKHMYANYRGLSSGTTGAMADPLGQHLPSRLTEDMGWALQNLEQEYIDHLMEVTQGIIDDLPMTGKHRSEYRTKLPSVIEDIEAGQSIFSTPVVTQTEEKKLAIGEGATQFRKAAQGVKNFVTTLLIGQHVFRVIAGTSQVFAKTQNAVSRGFGYMLDMILLPIIPIGLAMMGFFILLGNTLRPVTKILAGFTQIPLVAWIAAGALVLAGLFAFGYSLRTLYREMKIINADFSAMQEKSTASAGPGILRRLWDRRKGKTEEPPTYLKGGLTTEGLAYLHDGELVVPANVVSKMDKIPHFADGGIMGSSGNFSDLIGSGISGFAGGMAGVVGDIASNPAVQGLVSGMAVIGKVVGSVLAPIAAFGVIGSTISGGLGRLGALISKGDQAQVATADSVGRAQRNLLTLVNLELMTIIGGVVLLLGAISALKGPGEIGVPIAQMITGFINGLLAQWGRFVDDLIKGTGKFIDDFIKALIGKDSFFAKLFEKLFGKEAGFIPQLLEKLIGKESFIGKFIDGLLGGGRNLVDDLLKVLVPKGGFVDDLLKMLIPKSGTFIDDILKLIVGGGKAAVGAGGGILSKIGSLAGFGADAPAFAKGFKPTVAYIVGDWIAGLIAQGAGAANAGPERGQVGFRQDLATGSATTFAAGSAELLASFIPNLWPAISAFNIMGQYQFGKEGAEKALPEDMNYGQYKEYRINVTAEQIADWWNSTATSIKAVWDGMVSWWSTTWTGITEGVSGAIGSITGTFDSISATFTSITTTLAGIGGEAWAGITDAFSNLGAYLQSLPGSIIKAVDQWLTNLPIVGALYSGAKGAAGIPSFKDGGIMAADGLAYLHAGEKITPMSSSAYSSSNNRDYSNTSQITNNNTFVIQREDDNLLFQQMIANQERRYTS
jgi:hypothetical protein